MEVARSIVQREIDSMPFNDSERVALLKFLSKIKTRIGDLQCWRESFKAALEEYKDCILIIQKCEDPEKSRNLSEVNFMLANVYLYIDSEDAEDNAIHHYNEARKIIENILFDKIKIPFEKVNSKLNKTNLFVSDREFIRRENLLVTDKDPLDIVELKQILNSMYDKIEDTLIQKSQKEIFQKEKEELKSEVTETFKPVLPTQPVLHLGTFGNATNLTDVKNLGTFGSASKSNGDKAHDDCASTAEKESEQKMQPIIKRKLDLKNGDSDPIKKLKPE